MKPDFYKLLVEETPDALIARSPGGKVLHWNRGAETTFGYSSAEAVGRSLNELVIPPDQLEDEKTIRREALARGVATYESFRRKKDGSLIYINDSMRVIRNEAGQVEYFVTNKKDVTHFKVLRDSKLIEARYRDLLESTPDAIVIEAFLRPDQRSSRAAPAFSTVAAIPAKTRHGTILVVDDQHVNLSLKRSLLEPLGYVVLTAKGMAHALARQTPPDLIVSDVMMADGSGFDFIKAVKADPRLRLVPFVFLTSTYCDESSRAKGLALGADRFLFRPIEPQLLLAEIEACLQEQEKS